MVTKYDDFMCIKCHSGKLNVRKIKTDTAGRIVEGLITCNDCSATYPIVDGIPCFLSPSLRDNKINEIMEKYIRTIKITDNQKS